MVEMRAHQAGMQHRRLLGEEGGAAAVQLNDGTSGEHRECHAQCGLQNQIGQMGGHRTGALWNTALAAARRKFSRPWRVELAGRAMPDWEFFLLAVVAMGCLSLATHESSPSFSTAF